MFENEPLLEKIVKAEGFAGIMELLEVATFDSVVPGICPECETTSDVEPDQTEGWCEVCGTQTVQSCLILAGII